MTTGDLFTPRQQPQKYRQGNYQESLYPLNERPAVRSQNESLYTQVLDDGVELSTVNDVGFIRLMNGLISHFSIALLLDQIRSRLLIL